MLRVFRRLIVILGMLSVSVCCFPWSVAFLGCVCCLVHRDSWYEEKQMRRAAAATADGRTKSVPYKSTWLAFRASRKGLSLKEVSVEWQGMSLREQLMHQGAKKETPVEAQPIPRDLEEIRRLTPLGIGDESCPMALDFLADVAANVKKLSDQFIRRYGDLIGSTAEMVKPSAMCCDQEFAWRECRLHLTRENLEKIKRTKALLAASSKLTFHSANGTPGLAVVSFVFTDSASSSAEPPPSRTYACGASLHGPIEVIFFPCIGGCGPVVAADELVINESFHSVTTESMLAMDLYNCAWKVEQVIYSSDAPLRLLVTETKDVTIQLHASVSGQRTDEDVKALLRQKRKASKAKVRISGFLRPKRKKSTADGDSDSDSGEDSERWDPDLDEEIDEYWKVKAEWKDATVSVPPAADEDLAEVHQQTEFVQWLKCGTSGRKLATISTFTKGSYESYSVYCNLHGCKDVVHVSKAPSLHSLRIWAKAGLANPARVAGKADHHRALRLLTRGG
jgi:hypothetical protein